MDLNKFPDTLLGNHESRKHYYDIFRDEYYFNRNQIAFDSILYYYQSGEREHTNVCAKAAFFQLYHRVQNLTSALKELTVFQLHLYSNSLKYHTDSRVQLECNHVVA